ncbi:hypothetical protein A3770_11p64730 [Chloropicon primus]|uniref:Uncharacterized protein n=1 Tax=Chloropicon primus TaxID=1764295 RepID=A0A5B8MWD8_9CHLO|nr:hypothetical protein A3770_11p64730 [Chloropicon primus]|eukprot:QDZ23955.1 hypothetical protein A3770_11p64730 [Chloropicon primus]
MALALSVGGGKAWGSGCAGCRGTPRGLPRGALAVTSAATDRRTTRRSNHKRKSSRRRRTRTRRERERERQSKRESGLERAVRDGRARLREASSRVAREARNLGDRLGGRRGTTGFTISADRPGAFSPSSEMARARLGSRTIEYIVLGTLAVLLVAAKALPSSRTRNYGRGNVRGTWVKDRSLGGKMIFVPATSSTEYDFSSSSSSSSSPSTPYAASSAAEARASPAATREVSKKPVWWLYDDFSGPVREGARPQVQQLVRLLEGAKQSYGRDVNMGDLCQLKLICQDNSLTVAPKTASGRDSMFRTAVEGALDAVEEGRASVGLGNDGVHDFLTGLCVAIGVPQDRALTISSGETAARLRSLLLQAVVSLRTKDDLDLLKTLIRIDNVLTTMPFPLKDKAPEVEVITRSLRNSINAEEGRKIYAQFPQAKEDNLRMMRAMLNLSV